MRMLWIVTIAVVLFATVSHANRVNATHPNADALTAPSVTRAPTAFRAACPAVSIVSLDR
jgi:hypothetical protein